MKLYLGNLPLDVTETTIRDELLCVCALKTLLSIRVLINQRTGKSQGFAFIELDSSVESAALVNTLNGFVFRERKLICSYVKETTEIVSRAYKATPTTSTEDEPRRKDGRRRRNSDDEFNGPWH